MPHDMSVHVSRSDRSRTGSVLILVVIMLPCILALLLLAVDLSHIQTAKSQLFDVSEGVARYAVTGIVDGTAVTKAQSVASQARIDGRTISIQGSDIEL